MSARPSHLETFAEAAESGSYTAAARRLGVQAETISQRVQQLEAWLNTTLFHRAAGGVTLTATGCRLEAYARRIIKLPAEAWAAVTAEPDAVTGDLLLPAGSVPGQHLLPPALRRAAGGGARRPSHPLLQRRVHLPGDAELPARHPGRARAESGGRRLLYGYGVRTPVLSRADPWSSPSVADSRNGPRFLELRHFRGRSGFPGTLVRPCRPTGPLTDG